MEKRFRATVYVDLWAESGKGASFQLNQILRTVPNSFSDGLSELKHGSEISLIDDKESETS